MVILNKKNRYCVWCKRKITHCHGVTWSCDVVKVMEDRANTLREWCGYCATARDLMMHSYKVINHNKLLK